MIHQLRIYEIFERTRDAFLDRFERHSARIMRRHGFDVVATWQARTEQRLEFVYLLAWPDEETKDAAWSVFLHDEEWIAIKRAAHAEHGRLVGEIEDRVLVPAGNAAMPAGTAVEGRHHAVARDRPSPPQGQA
jgi:heme-degrading monooxygenase HmoA